MLCNGCQKNRETFAIFFDVHSTYQDYIDVDCNHACQECCQKLLAKNLIYQVTGKWEKKNLIQRYPFHYRNNNKITYKFKGENEDSEGKIEAQNDDDEFHIYTMPKIFNMLNDSYY